MKRYVKKEDGVTLVELLAVLAILSFLSVLVFGVFVNGFSYSKKANDTVSLQQEVNLIFTAITKHHESHTSYSIVLDQNPNATSFKLQFTNATGNISTTELSNSKYQYTVYQYSGNTDSLMENTKEINTSDPLSIKIIIQDKEKPENKYEARTIISRL
jgi:prepilin-type N-terminal cleavage/methylation domain-containing protein